MEGCMSAFAGMEPAELSPGLAQLKGEHPSLRKKLEDMKTLVEKLNSEQTIDGTYTELKQQMTVFKAELDPHSEREEGVLFPMIGEYIGTTAGPIAVMEYEHEQAKMSIKAFLEKANENTLSGEEMKSSAAFVTNAVNILTEHFTKEENVLFPMAEKMLSEEEKAELHKRIQEIN